MEGMYWVGTLTLILVGLYEKHAVQSEVGY